MSCKPSTLQNTDLQIDTGEFHREGCQLLQTLCDCFLRGGYNIADASVSTGRETPLTARIVGEYDGAEVRLVIEGLNLGSGFDLGITVQFAPNPNENSQQEHRITWDFEEIEDALQYVSRIPDAYDDTESDQYWTVGQETLRPSE